MIVLVILENMVAQLVLINKFFVTLLTLLHHFYAFKEVVVVKSFRVVEGLVRMKLPQQVYFFLG